MSFLETLAIILAISIFHLAMSKRWNALEKRFDRRDHYLKGYFDQIYISLAHATAHRNELASRAAENACHCSPSTSHDI
ncbi:hypothetical protein DFH09DRAFT_1127357, partial [Mycena vulgaris]